MKKTKLHIAFIFMITMLLSIFVLSSCGDEEHTHNYSNDWAKDGSYHWQSCSGCEEIRNKSEHDWNSGIITLQPTETNEGIRTFACNTCGYTRVESVSILEHKHTFAEYWSMDESYHWHSTTCEHITEKKNYGEHDWNSGVVTTEPTTSIQGIKTYICQSCGKTKTEDVPKLEEEHTHIFDQMLPEEKYLESSATCTDKAKYYKSCTCGLAGTIDFEYGEALGHSYSNVWDFNDTHHWYVATCEHTSETKDKGEHDWDSGVVTLEPTITSNGIQTFTCETCRKTKTEDIPQIEEVHTHTYNQLVSDDKYLNNSATCVVKATYFYSCSCGLAGTETFEYGDLADHKFTTYTSNRNATCTTDGTKTAICDICKTATDEIIDVGTAKGHSYSDEWDRDETNHWHNSVCGHIGETSNKDIHNWNDWVVTLEPTCQTEGSKYHICTICEYKATEIIPIDPDAHSAEIEWICDESTHWHKCAVAGCDIKLDVGEHDWNDGVITKQATETIEGEKTYTCDICNETKVETLGKLDHVHRFASEYTLDDNYHWFAAICGHTSEVSQKEEHEYGDDNCCDVCGYERIVNVSGIILNKTEATVNFGDSLNLIATILPDNATDKNVTWHSSDETIAKVVNGAVTTLNMGTVTITATTTNGISAQCVVTIVGHAVIQFERSGGFYIVTGIEGKTDKLEIPFLHDGLRVKAIQENAFYGNTDLKEVILPNSIEYIYENAFMNCSNLEKINLPDSLTFIDESAFENCTSLKEITIPGLTETISARAFYNCTSLKKLTTCEGVKYIGVSTFAFCATLETVIVGNGLETISDYAFDSCVALKSFEMPNTVKYLGDFAFRYAESLEYVTFSQSLTAIGIGCFQSCVSLDNVELHAGIVSFGESCFSWCSGMKTLRILGDVTLLDDSSFYECTSLENVYYASSIPGDLGVNNYVFYNAGINGKGITFTLAANATIPERLFEPQVNLNRPKLVKLVLENGATSVDYFDRYNNLPYLAEIVLPDTITYIKKGCFDNTSWWNDHADGAAYIGNVFYGYKGDHVGDVEISDNTVCVALGALKGLKPSSLKIPFVGAIANGNENTHFGYIFGAETPEVQKDYIPDELISVYIKKCQYTIYESALNDCGFEVKIIHQWNDWETTINETCQTEGEEKRVCSICNEVDTRKRSIDPDAHCAETEWLCDENTHWHKCTNEGCNAKLDSVDHNWNDWVVTLEPTCQTEGSRYHDCTICEYKATDVISIDINAHLYANVNKNSDGHWYSCAHIGCSSTTSLGEHYWNDWVVILEPTCQQHGIKSKICYICEYELKGDIEINPEAHDVSESWKSDSNFHWHECINDGCKSKWDEGEHIWNDEAKCKICQYYTYSGLNLEFDNKTLSYRITEYTGNENVVILPSIFSGYPVTKIAAGAFYGCDKLTSITIPDSITVIGGSAFSGCSALTNIMIPESVTKIGAGAFSGCSSLENITLPFVGGSKSALAASSSTLFGYIFGASYYVGGIATTQYYDSVDTVTCATYYIPLSLKSVNITGGDIFFGAFFNCTTIENVVLGNGVTSIGEFAFYMSGIESVIIPDSTIKIEEGAFEFCDNLVNVTIGQSVQSIGPYAFHSCDSLISITIGESVETIGVNAFGSCTKLVEIINHSSLNFTIGFSSYGGVAYYAKEIHSGTSKIVNVNDYLFYTHDKVNYLLGYIGNDAELVLPMDYNGQSYEIYSSAFSGLYDITSVTISGSVTAIGERAFFGCYRLKNATIKGSVKFIGNHAFNSCESLTNVVVSEFVENIGDGGFMYCSNLRTIKYSGTSVQWDSISKSTNWDYETGSYTITYNYAGE